MCYAAILISLVAIAITSSDLANARESCQRLGNQTYCSDGRLYDNFGNTTYDRNGRSWQQLGNQVRGSDGRVYSEFDNQTYDSRGKPLECPIADLHTKRRHPLLAACERLTFRFATFSLTTYVRDERDDVYDRGAERDDDFARI